MSMLTFQVRLTVSCFTGLVMLALAPDAAKAHWLIDDLVPLRVPGHAHVDGVIAGGFAGNTFYLGRFPDWRSALNGLDPFAAAPSDPLGAPPDWLLVPHHPRPEVVPEPGTLALAAVTAALVRRRR